MSHTIEYKGYIGSVEFSEKDMLFFGKVQGIRTLISFEGKNATDLISDFHNAVEDYLSACKQAGKQPEKAFKGSFNVRISPEYHRAAYEYAITHQMSLNSFVETCIIQGLASNA